LTTVSTKNLLSPLLLDERGFQSCYLSFASPFVSYGLTP
jgi:hypothetical protein